MYSHFPLPIFSLLFAILVSLAQCDPAPPRRPTQTSPPRPYITCFDEPVVPRMADCLALNILLHVAIRKPGENLRKRWGRSEHDTPLGRTAHLPKQYWTGKIDPGSPPSSCMLYLDEFPREGLPSYDYFRLEDIADTGERLTYRCLINEGRGGFDYPGQYGTVYTKLTLYNPLSNGKVPSLPGRIGESSALGDGNWTVRALTTEAVGNETLTLYEASIEDTSVGPSQTASLGQSASPAVS